MRWRSWAVLVLTTGMGLIGIAGLVSRRSSQDEEQRDEDNVAKEVCCTDPEEGITTPWAAPKLDVVAASCLTDVVAANSIACPADRVEVLDTLADCSAFAHNQLVLGQGDHLTQIIQCLEAADPDEQQAAARALGNLATCATNQRELACALPVLLKMMSQFGQPGDPHPGCSMSASQVVLNLTHSRISTHKLVLGEPHPVQRTLIAALASDAPVNNRLQLRALSILINLAFNRDSVCALVDAGAMPVLLLTLERCGSIEVLQKVLTLTAYLASDARVPLLAASLGSPLQQLMTRLASHADEEVSSWAARANDLMFP